MNRSETEVAYAKINLALHVRKREPDGYHRIETLFAFAQDGDLLTAEPAEALILTVSGPYSHMLSTEPNNLVIGAARALREVFGVREGAALRLDKRLPVASGVGGGSADAAATLRILSRLWGLSVDEDRLEDMARNLGADVPACIRSRPARGMGRGDVLEDLEDNTLAGLPLLLINPGVPVATGAVFAAWDGIDRGPLAKGDPLVVARMARNDLEQPALRIASEIGEALALLRRADGVTLTRMSGSGATCFALFEDMAARDAADLMVARAQPGWWRLKTALREQDIVP